MILEGSECASIAAVGEPLGIRSLGIRSLKLGKYARKLKSQAVPTAEQETGKNCKKNVVKDSHSKERKTHGLGFTVVEEVWKQVEISKEETLKSKKKDRVLRRNLRVRLQPGRTRAEKSSCE